MTTPYRAEAAKMAEAAREHLQDTLADALADAVRNYDEAGDGLNTARDHLYAVIIEARQVFTMREIAGMVGLSVGRIAQITRESTE